MGNDHFKRGEYTEAINLYGHGLAVVSREDQELKAVLLGNRAQCYLNLRMYLEALEASK